MKNQYSRFVGWMKQPIQQPEEYNPTMYMLSDLKRSEVDLVLLTPGSFLHAYKFLTTFNAKMVRLFVPSIRYEWISDIFNLYMLKKDKTVINWVFPKDIDHTDFSDGLIKTMNYMNLFDNNISISYVENENVDDVYDIIIRDDTDVKYFSQYLTKEKAEELYDNIEYTSIHVPYSSTMYGGLTYNEVLNIRSVYRTKYNPHSFISIDELEKYLSENNIAFTPDKYFNDFDIDFEGEITEDDIDALLES